MKVQITINCHNAAFESADLGPELARILRGIVDDVKYWQAESCERGNEKLRDINGNTVGTF